MGNKNKLTTINETTSDTSLNIQKKIQKIRYKRQKKTLDKYTIKSIQSERKQNRQI